MAATLPLREHDLYRASWDDGLLDLLAGVAVIGIGLSWAVDLAAVGAGLAPLSVVLFAPLRRRIVEPRAGFVEFSAARQARTTRGLGASVAAGVGMLALLVAAGAVVARSEVPVALVAGLPAALLAPAAVVGGILTGARRFYACAVGLLVVGALTAMADAEPWIGLAAAGAGVAACGGWLLARFLRDTRGFDADGPT